MKELAIITEIIQTHKLEDLGNPDDCKDLESNITHDVMVKLHFNLLNRLRLIEAHKK